MRRSTYFNLSQKYIEGIINCVRGLRENASINVYATTNPLNTKHIAERAFGLGERGNIKHLYVFQQTKDGRRRFEEKGKIIYQSETKDADKNDVQKLMTD